MLSVTTSGRARICGTWLRSTSAAVADDNASNRTVGAGGGVGNSGALDQQLPLASAFR
jgi:hypothetical protein